MGKPVMNEHNPALIARRRARRLRRWLAGVGSVGRPGGPVVLMVARCRRVRPQPRYPTGRHQKPGGGFTPTTPVDAFADHWEKYHKGKDATQEPKTIPPTRQLP